jgi:hypothetical protein
MAARHKFHLLEFVMTLKTNGGLEYWSDGIMGVKSG